MIGVARTATTPEMMIQTALEMIIHSLGANADTPVTVMTIMRVGSHVRRNIRLARSLSHETAIA